MTVETEVAPASGLRPAGETPAPSPAARPPAGGLRHAAAPRVAFFPDSYFEVNGVAHTSRELEAFARRRGLPFLCVRGGEETRYARDGALTQLTLKRGPVALRLGEGLRSDALLWRHVDDVLRAVSDFRPDVIHVTGPSDVGQLGLYAAHRLKLPLVASWHTNLHEFAGARSERAARLLPGALKSRLRGAVQRCTLDAALWFYRQAQLILAPNEELAGLLAARARRPVRLMRRGVDTDLFTPARRDRCDRVFRLGYVGRLRPEKNVRLLAELERELFAAGHTNIRFVVVGEGCERPWLERHLRAAQFTGVLRGEALARAYANLDLFVFPSATDTFGNVVLEALASGVPAVVTDGGGPKFIVADGASGCVAAGERDFKQAVVKLLSESQLHKRMREAARRRACEFSWENVFEQVYETYRECAPAAAPTGGRPAREVGREPQPEPEYEMAAASRGGLRGAPTAQGT
jgi:phosphatidylinositol alpha 1,6-mannosyltransferase